MRRRDWWALVPVAATAALTACGGAVSSGAPGAADTMAKQASRAMTAMTAGHFAVPSRFAAAAAVRNVTAVQAQVLRADGFTKPGSGLSGRTGSVTLRFESTPGRQRDTTAPRCYQYVFDLARRDADRPRRIGCPAGARPLADPGPLPLVTESTRATVTTALTSLTTGERRDPARVRAAVAARLGGDYLVTATAANATLSVRVEASDTCLDATAEPPRAGRVVSGLDCDGG